MSRIGGKNYQLGKYSFSYYVMILFLIIGTIFTGILLSYHYHQETESIQSEYLLSQRYGEEALVNAIQLADQSFSFYDNVFNPPLRLGLFAFRDAYNQSSRHPEEMDLAKIKENVSSYFDLPIDLYIINSSGVIQASTFEPDIGLDIGAYPRFRERLTTIREGDSIAYDAIVTGTQKGEERKYAYIPTPDHLYILEIGINLDDFFKREGISKYPRLATWYNATQPDVNAVWIFSRSAIFTSNVTTSIQGFEVYPFQYREDSNRRAYLNQAFSQKTNIEAFDPVSGTYKKYLYIPQIRSSSVSAGLFDKVAEITYSTSVVKEKENQAFNHTIFLAIAVIAIVALIAFLISRFITNPVYQIIEDIGIIANGDYNHTIRRTKGFEFHKLENSIQKMVLHLKSDIISIREKSDELDHELRHRLSVEKSLRLVNYKLSLLGSITRHDMLNQISIVSSGLDLLEDDVSDEDMQRIIPYMRDAVGNIQEMIQFSKVYEEMGVHEPIWHTISEKISESSKNCTIEPHMISDNTAHFEILADPMFDRVIFNLIENALRHGKKVSHIEFSVVTRGDARVLVVSDDGIGVLDSEKEKIFERGYGKNTGLGLFLTREILSLTDIHISETGTYGEGTRFELYIPKGKWRYIT